MHVIERLERDFDQASAILTPNLNNEISAARPWRASPRAPFLRMSAAACPSPPRPATSFVSPSRDPFDRVVQTP